MRGAIAVVAAAVLVAAAVGGCAYKRTHRTPEGDVTVERQGEKITLESDEGKVEIEMDRGSATIAVEGEGTTVEISQEASEKEIGIPFYPGAKAEHTATATTERQEASAAFAQVVLRTPDSVAKVKAFYQKQLPKATVALEMETPAGRVVHMLLEEDDIEKTIQISRDKETQQTTILLVRRSGGSE